MVFATRSLGISLLSQQSPSLFRWYLCWYALRILLMNTSYTSPLPVGEWCRVPVLLGTDLASPDEYAMTLHWCLELQFCRTCPFLAFTGRDALSLVLCFKGGCPRSAFLPFLGFSPCLSTFYFLGCLGLGACTVGEASSSDWWDLLSVCSTPRPCMSLT